MQGYILVYVKIWLEFMKECTRLSSQVQCQAPDIGPNISPEGGPESTNPVHVRRIARFSVKHLTCIADLYVRTRFGQELTQECQAHSQVLCQEPDLVRRAAGAVL